MAKKSKEVPVLSISKKSTEVSKLKVTGLEKCVSRLRDRENQIEELSKLQKEEEAVVIDEVKKERISAEKRNEFFKCCLVLGQDEEQPLKVQFSNRYSKISYENESVLRECLGSLYLELFAEKTTVRVRDDISPEMLKQKLGEDLYTFLFTEEKTIVPCDMETRAKLRQTMGDKSNSVVDQLREQVSQKPSIFYGDK